MTRRWKTFLALAVVAGGAGLITGASDTGFTPRQKAYYLDANTVAFVRPGLVFKVTRVTVAADGTVSARFTITDPMGLPLDRNGVTTPGTVSTSFVLSRIPKGGQFYQAYTKRTKTSSYPGTAGKTARQASNDTGGRYVTIADGEYDYIFGTKLPADYQKNATHTVGIYGSRNLTEFDLGTDYASVVFHWVPDGGPVTEIRDLINDQSCNKCHDEINFHGGSRRGLPTCILCHTPAYEDVTNLNPETDNIIDMRVMIHKIHMGAQLPSVQAGKPYQIVGYQNVVHDYSKVNIPSEPHNCQKCHETSATQSNAYLTRPTRASCGACHDDVNFASGQGHANGIPQANDNACSQCHIPQGETDFDASIKGAHVDPQDSSLITGIVAKITSVESSRAGERPVVNFTLKDRNGALLEPSKVDRINFVLGGPTTDFGDGLPVKGGYVSESAKAATATQSGWRYQFTQAIPADAKGSFAIAAEARRVETVLSGTVKEMNIQSGSPNDIVYFPVDGSATAPRRKVVDLQKCNDCHRYLSIHGENRNSTEYCVMCHNPTETDVARRPPDKGAPEGIDFALMIHRIHGGNRQKRDYTIYGYNSNAYNFNYVVFPGVLANCLNCHLDGTYNVPPPARLDKTDPRGWVNPAKPSNAACGGCHVSQDAASHALVNTSQLGESCAVCHGPNASYSVDRVHAQ
jgi:OmcA/MtrC family decaheme c-type cytochrome